MNLLQDCDDPNNLFFVSFNQDSSSLSVGTKNGYKIYSLNSTEKLEKIHEDTSQDIAIVERLFSSSLIAVVSHSSPRKLCVFHYKRKAEICTPSYTNTILAVKINRQRLIVCLEGSIFIHEMRNLSLVHTIRDTPPNPNGLIALSPNSDNCLLAYPGNDKIGEVAIFDAVNLQNKMIIPAHDNALAALAFNPDGTKIATASEKGTVIRVFLVSDGQMLYEFRRGFARCVCIYSLCFSADSLFLCASSNTETVHIFKLEDPKETKNQEEGQSWIGYIANYLPTPVADMFNQWRSFATARLPFSGLKNVCGFTVINKIPRILVASANGYLYIYNLNVSESGECEIVKQHKLDGNETIEGRSVPADSLGPSNSRSDATNFPSADYDGDFPPITYKTNL